MSFEYPYLLALLLLLPPLWFVAKGGGDSLGRRFAPELYRKMVAGGGGLSREKRRALMLFSAAFAIIALARPVIDRGEIKIAGSVRDLAVAFDISRSMFADDIYPNRLEMAKRKFRDLLDSLKDTRVAVIGFSSRAFLVAPLTADYESLKYLVGHMGADYVSLKGTDMMAPLEVTGKLLGNRAEKGLLIFTDGGDDRDFSKEIDYAEKHGIKVFIYALGTKKGGVMRLPNGGVVRDGNGDVVITRLNPSVRELAEATGGVYLTYSSSSSDMKRLAARIESALGAARTEERTLRNRLELFYYPLALAVLLFLTASTSLPRAGRAAAGGGFTGVKDV
ncbi:TPR domain protein in aerotolerance operon [Hydrogenimonas sp.]|nr:TPR domain protein in aerotolerance operon [Hydrogenimonas sp.]